MHKLVIVQAPITRLLEGDVSPSDHCCMGLKGLSGLMLVQDLISIFNDHELELLISGLPEIDVDDLRRNTEYSGYTAASRTVQWFWETVQGLDKEDLALLVQFVTGTSKVPLDGFKALQVPPLS